MAGQMSRLWQPSVTASWVRDFGGFDAGHAWVVNFVVVVLLSGIGTCLLSARPVLVRICVAVGAMLCKVNWALIQDFGIFGGVGTDPNSMVPMMLAITAGYPGMI